jgi:hypothetical protein
MRKDTNWLLQLSDIVEFRNGEILWKTSHAIHENLAIVRQIAFQSDQRSETLATLAVQCQRDSKRLKALTQVATMYLPATLIAVSDHSPAI